MTTQPQTPAEQWLNKKISEGYSYHCLPTYYCRHNMYEAFEAGKQFPQNPLYVADNEDIDKALSRARDKIIEAVVQTERERIGKLIDLEISSLRGLIATHTKILQPEYEARIDLLLGLKRKLSEAEPDKKMIE